MVTGSVSPPIVALTLDALSPLAGAPFDPTMSLMSTWTLLIAKGPVSDDNGNGFRKIGGVLSLTVGVVISTNDGGTKKFDGLISQPTRATIEATNMTDAA